ncbi:MAG: rod shape-determining protein MreD, partial [Actinomycetota bacterium]|nr:rod shape-determining protein MreD [Actinomycetota bacterium]
AFFVAVVAQAAVVSSVDPGGGTADLVLVTLAAVALLRGSTFGALAGFYAGFLLDTANLQTLGVSSLLLTLAGYWIGRYGETTGREAGGQRSGVSVTTRRLSAHAPLLSIAIVTVLYLFGSLGLHAMLGEAVSVRAGLEALPAQILLNLATTIPIYALCRRLFAPGPRTPAAEVEFS